MNNHHTSVLLNESIEALQVRPGGRYIDCTLGEGGHSAVILEKSSPGGQLLGLDADPQAVKSARPRLKQYGESVILVNVNFCKLAEICSEYNFRPVHGIIFDLGLSSLQLAEKGRGFSFQQEAPLDMRFSPDQKLDASQIVNDYSESDLAMLIWQYGEESKSRRIARNIVDNRPLKTTSELARIVAKAFGGNRKKIHPATKTFQALRIAVNQEIENLKSALEQTTNLLEEGGRLAVISFHSLEDRSVKEFMNHQSSQCICPPEIPVCICNHNPTLRIVNRRIIKPTKEETMSNPRSRSARLRVAERINPN